MGSEFYRKVQGKTVKQELLEHKGVRAAKIEDEINDNISTI